MKDKVWNDKNNFISRSAEHLETNKLLKNDRTRKTSEIENFENK